MMNIILEYGFDEIRVDDEIYIIKDKGEKTIYMRVISLQNLLVK